MIFFIKLFAFLIPSYEYHEDTMRYVEIRYEHFTMIGKLDSHGLFQPHELHKEVKRFGNQSVCLLNANQRRVFELRSGILIPGWILEDGYFKPDHRSKMMKFKDYQYFPASAPIWNLPGTFKPSKSCVVHKLFNYMFNLKKD
jgi:hypothetical protein